MGNTQAPGSPNLPAPSPNLPTRYRTKSSGAVASWGLKREWNPRDRTLSNKFGYSVEVLVRLDKRLMRLPYFRNG